MGKIKNLNYVLLSILIALAIHLSGFVITTNAHSGLNSDAGGILLRIAENRQTISDAPHERHFNRIAQYPALILLANNNWKVNNFITEVFIFSHLMLPLFIILLAVFFTYKKDPSFSFVPLMLYFGAIYPVKLYLFNIADDVAATFILIVTFLTYYIDKEWAKLVVVALTLATVFSYEMAFIAYASIALIILLNKRLRSLSFSHSYLVLLALCSTFQLLILWSIRNITRGGIEGGMNSISALTSMSSNIYFFVLGLAAFTLIAYRNKYTRALGYLLTFYLLYAFIISFQKDSWIQFDSFHFRVAVIPLSTFFATIIYTMKKDIALKAPSLIIASFLLVMLSISFLRHDIIAAKRTIVTMDTLKDFMNNSNKKCVVASQEITEKAHNAGVVDWFIPTFSIHAWRQVDRPRFIASSQSQCDEIMSQPNSILKQLSTKN